MAERYCEGCYASEHGLPGSGGPGPATYFDRKDLEPVELLPSFNPREGLYGGERTLWFCGPCKIEFDQLLEAHPDVGLVHQPAPHAAEAHQVADADTSGPARVFAGFGITVRLSAAGIA